MSKKSFIDMNDKEKKEILEEILDINHYAQISEEARKQYTEFLRTARKKGISVVIKSTNHPFDPGDLPEQAIQEVLGCSHEWVDYLGFNEKYKFCKKCDLKKT